MAAKYFYNYVNMVAAGKPISDEVAKALDRAPYYIEHFHHNTRYTDALIAFIENNLYLQKGGHNKFILETEQKFWIEMLGYEHEDGLPVITDLGLIIGAGSGKSTFMAGLSLAVMMVGSHTGNDVLVLANTKEQAQELFRVASEMVQDDQSPIYLFKQNDLIQPVINKIRYTPTNSLLSIKAMDNKSADGVNVRMAIFDEFHSYTENVIENIRKSSAPKRIDTGFTTVYISTNGQVRGAVFDSYYKRWEKILDGDIIDWSTFPMIYKMNDKSEVTEPELYERAMPFIKHISKPEIVYNNLLKTEGNPVAQSEMLAKSFNIPQSNYNALFTTATLSKCRAVLDADYSRNVVVGYDLSAVDDLSAIVVIAQAPGKIYRIYAHAFLPEQTFNQRANRESRLRYAQLIDEGSLTLLPGSEIDEEQVFDWLDNFLHNKNYYPLGVAGDAFYAKRFQKRAREEWGEDIVYKVRQNAIELSEPLKKIKAGIDGGRIELTNELLTWTFGNLRVRADANGNIFPNKDKSTDKIDPVSAATAGFWLFNKTEDVDDYTW